MPQWLLVASHGKGVSQNSGLTNYISIGGSIADLSGTETRIQAIARDTYTLADLLVRVIANDLDGTTIVRTRENAGNGNQSVSILTTQTGTFQDAVNSDVLVDGGLFNYQIVTAGSSGAIDISIISTTLATASNNTPIIGGSGRTFAGTSYCAIVGGMPYAGGSSCSATEAHAQYTFRTAAILSNLRFYYDLYNYEDGVVRVRINGVDGNLVISIPAAGTGIFEDAVNSDSISVGDEVCLEFTPGTPTGGGASLVIQGLSLKSSSLSRQTACADAGPYSTQDWDAILYFAPEGPIQSDAQAATTEANVQCLTRMAFDAKNFFVNVKTNTVNGARTVTTRINGGDGSLSVSVGAAATGFFEDLVNTDTLADDDLYNYKVGTGGTEGTTDFSVIGFEQQEPTAPPPVGLENKSANMAAKMIAGGFI